MEFCGIFRAFILWDLRPELLLTVENWPELLRSGPLLSKRLISKVLSLLDRVIPMGEGYFAFVGSPNKVGNIRGAGQIKGSDDIET